MSRDETILMTGFPGFIAGRLVKRLAADGFSFLLLVQPALVPRANKEIAEISAKQSTASSTFRILEGDITQPNLGLSESDRKMAREMATTIFHLAAVYDLAVARELGMLVNVEGTRNVNRFALAMPRLERYHYVSTCYVSGLRQGLIMETELEHHAGFRNYYEETKYLAEIEVDKLKTRLPTTIHRPAVVCGDSRSGETAKYDGVYYLIQYLRKFPSFLSLVNIGNREVSLNLVPVDFVVEAMAALAKDDASIGATVQLADSDPPSTFELFDAIARALRGRASRVQLPPAVVRSTLALPFSPTFTGLPRAGVPYFFLRQEYDTSRARELLAPFGISCPRFSDYAGALISFVEDHPSLG